MYRINIVGAGKVGTTLAIALRENGHEIGSVYSRTIKSSIDLVNLVGSGRAIENVSDLGKADITFISTSDGSISSVANVIAAQDRRLDGEIFVHCSGALPSTILVALKKRGALISSLHPIKSFTNPIEGARTFSETWCEIEGDQSSNRVIQEIFTEIGAICFAIETEKKILYHLGAVIICNFFFPIFEYGIRCYEESGVERKSAIAMVSPMIRSTVENCLREGAVTAMTGPIARGDIETVEMHLQALKELPSIFGQIYNALGMASTDAFDIKG